MSDILITGGAGFIGSHLCELLLDTTDNKIIILDNFSTGKIENIPNSDRVVSIKGDIADINVVNEIHEKYSVDTIFHLAAVASVQQSFVEPISTHNSNLTGTILLLNTFKNSLNHFVYASSAATYGDTLEIPTTENAKQVPLSPYGIDKLSGEMYLRIYGDIYGFSTTACRFFNVFGERQDPSSPYSGVISIFFDKVKDYLEGNESTITIFGDGEQTRDFIYVKDVVRALEYLKNYNKNSFDVFNIGYSGQISINQLANDIKEYSKCDINVVHKEARAGDIKISQANNSKLLSTGFKFKYSYNEGLKKLTSYVLGNE